MARKDKKIVPPVGPATERARLMEERKKKQAEIKLEQAAMNEAMGLMFGKENNPRLLKVDGYDKRGDGQKSATDSVREILDGYMNSIEVLRGLPTRADKLRELNKFLATEAGQKFLKDKQVDPKDGRVIADTPALIEGMRSAVNGIPPLPNGFQDGTGPNPSEPVDPKNTPVAAPGKEVAVAPPVEAPKPEPERVGEGILSLPDESDKTAPKPDAKTGVMSLPDVEDKKEPPKGSIKNDGLVILKM